MAKYQFSPIQRMAIWKAHQGKCAYRGELIPFDDLEIDHILPESLLENPDELERIKLEYGLSSDFDINSYYNWLPSCHKCNSTKSDRVYSKSAIFHFLEMVAKPKYEEIRRIEQNLETTMKKKGFLTRTQAIQLIEEHIKDFVINNLILSPATKRRDKWIDEYLSKAVQAIAEKATPSVVENLPNNELFITVVLQATSIALRNHQKEKLEALRNAIINSVLPNAPDESLQLMFLNFIDSFTPCHLIMIDFINDPKDWCIKNNVKVDEFMNHYSYKSEKPYELDIFLQKISPQIKTKKYLYEQAIEDISTNGLIACPKSTQRPFLVTLSSLDLHKNRIYLSDAGKQFLNYIKFYKKN
jgi:hypothetical protein